jgi:hypothetical protein
LGQPLNRLRGVIHNRKFRTVQVGATGFEPAL